MRTVVLTICLLLSVACRSRVVDESTQAEPLGDLTAPTFDTVTPEPTPEPQSAAPPETHEPAEPVQTTLTRPAPVDDNPEPEWFSQTSSQPGLVRLGASADAPSVREAQRSAVAAGIDLLRDHLGLSTTDRLPEWSVARSSVIPVAGAGYRSYILIEAQEP